MLPEPQHTPTERQPVPAYAPGGEFGGEPRSPNATAPPALPPPRSGSLRNTASWPVERNVAPDANPERRFDSTMGAPAVGRARAWPAAGAEFGGFVLTEEIGRGSFSRVYLARQPALGDRFVVLKVSTAASGEAETLARLSHPHIVPVHSAHQVEGFHLVCMPYLGAVTLADVYRTLDSMPSLPATGRGLFSTLRTRREHALTSVTGGDGRPAAPLPPDESAALTSLEGRSYVEAVLWLVARLAEALAHAHDRGVVHRDLKPANVLLADDGRPMLLDFNLATPASDARGDGSGGTPHYMSPEQLSVFSGVPVPVDGRADLYSLGVVLYELLSRRSPSHRHKGTGPDALRAMIYERLGPPPRLRPWNRAVSPAVEAIVRRCLEPEPANRYQSARELADDLDRHLADRPLRHTADPSARERVRKWGRRNRRLVAATVLLAMVATAATLTSVRDASRRARLDRLEATATFREFTAEAQVASALLVAGSDRAELDEGVQRGEAALARYGVGDRPDWWTGRAVQSLDPADRERLRARTGTLLILLGRATGRLAVSEAGRTDPTPGLRRALDLSATAQACYPGGSEPRALWEHRAELVRLLGRPEDARQLARQAAERPTEEDTLLHAGRHLTAGEYRLALPLLQTWTRDAPQDVAGWYLLGVCHQQLGQEAGAVACFSTCVALRSDLQQARDRRDGVMERLRGRTAPTR